MIRRLALAVLCLTTLATLGARVDYGDYYEAATYPGSQFDHGTR